LKTRGKPNRSPAAVIENLEPRNLFYAPIPAADIALETVQIRPKAGTYTSELTLTQGTTYFLRATGYVRNSLGSYDGDAAGAPASSTSTTAAASGITVDVGAVSLPTTDWGTAQADHVYGQSVTPTATGALSFVFANDGTPRTSTLAVTIYAAVPAITVATIRNNVAAGVVSVSALPSRTAFVPLNDADWDQNGIADDQQSGRVKGDAFLLPITLPAIADASAKSHLYIDPPHGLRVWLNPDRTGSTVGVGLRVSKPRTVYLEAYAEPAAGTVLTLKIMLPIDGVSLEQDVPVTVFALAGPKTATAGSKQVFSSDARAGEWVSAAGGTLNANTISVVNHVAYANVVWGSTTQTGLADFEADKDYLWGWPVEISPA
jgi:hypothetical protein